MQTYCTKNTLILGLTLSVALVAAATASASGSMPSPSRLPSTSGNATQSNSYDLGKAVYMEKISCSTCPVPEGANDAASAKMLLARVNENEFKLSYTEKRRLRTFLNRRFTQ